MNRSAINLFNFFFFQVIWFLSVVSAAEGVPSMGPKLTGLWMIYHLWLLGSQSQYEIRLLLSAAVIGYVSDSLLVVSGMLSFPEQAALGAPSSLWMVCLWINLAATLNFSLSWLKKRYYLAAILGAVAAPFAYYAGSHFGAVELNGAASLAAISIQWLIVMPALVWISDKLPQTALASCTNKPEDEHGHG